LSGAPLTVYGDGRQTRSFCYVSDLVEALMRTALSDAAGPMNLGNPNEFTIKECAELVIKVTGSKSKIDFAPLPEDDPKQRCPDISLAKKILGWEPRISLEEGLRLCVPYFAKQAEPLRTAV
jgi:nucleoside-diphosphate-sugar epimerase